MSYLEKYKKYKSKYFALRKLYGGDGDGDIFTEMQKYSTEKYKDDNSKADLVMQYDKSKGNLFVYDDKTIKLVGNDKKYVKFNWNEIKDQFKNGKLLVDQMKAIGWLRRLTVRYLLKDIDRECYTELGSTDSTSDFDFTYVSYTNPIGVVEKMINFYREFYKLYKELPYSAFDTNFYICNTYITKKCYDQNVNKGNLDNLFVANNSMYRLYWKTENSVLEALDRAICLNVQIGRIRGLSRIHSYGIDSLGNLIKYSTVFYLILDKFKTGGLPVGDTNIIVGILRSLYYMMTLYSNESYVCDTTFNIIVKGNFMSNIKDRLLAFIDNYYFIKEWHTVYMNDVDSSLDSDEKYIIGQNVGFFDMVCKYITRCDVCLRFSDLKIKLTSGLVEDASIWRDKIRGKHSVSEIISEYEEKGNMEDVIFKIYERIKSVHTMKNIMRIFDEQYNIVLDALTTNQNIVLTKAETFNKHLEHIILGIDNGTIEDVSAKNKNLVVDSSVVENMKTLVVNIDNAGGDNLIEYDSSKVDIVKLYEHLKRKYPSQ